MTSNLIVCSANRVTVYAVRRDGEREAETLDVCGEFDAQGAIGSISVLRRRFGAPRNQRDALLIAIRERKLERFTVAAAYGRDGEVCCSSMHSFESELGCNPLHSTLRMSREAACWW